MNVWDAAIVALGDAVKFESDGRDFYLRAAEQTRHPLGKAIFAALAEEEKEHVRRVREIYEELKNHPGWPDVASMVARRSGVLDAFERAAASLTTAVDADADARAALETALELERRGLAFYRDRLAKASCGAEEEFYRRLVAEEGVHLEALGRALAEVG
ncbi:MAG: ferritin family protein [Deferrisomatales bacterium]